MVFSVMRSPLDRISTESRWFSARLDHANRPGRVVFVFHGAILDFSEFGLPGAQEYVGNAAKATLQRIHELLALRAIHQRLAEPEIGDDRRIRADELRVQRDPRSWSE